MCDDELSEWHLITDMSTTNKTSVSLEDLHAPKCNDKKTSKDCMNSSKWAVVLGMTTLAAAGVLVHSVAKKR
tara:strand:+ start:15635 stop:15850 length:216 start_codon:yes stop_codon:yes gene_type:complete